MNPYNHMFCSATDLALVASFTLAWIAFGTLFLRLRDLANHGAQMTLSWSLARATWPVFGANAAIFAFGLVHCHAMVLG
jgi:hypothetical protein